jgi:hypothetical protein
MRQPPLDCSRSAPIRFYERTNQTDLRRLGPQHDLSLAIIASQYKLPSARLAEIDLANRLRALHANPDRREIAGAASAQAEEGTPAAVPEDRVGCIAHVAAGTPEYGAVVGGVRHGIGEVELVWRTFPRSCTLTQM